MYEKALAFVLGLFFLSGGYLLPVFIFFSFILLSFHVISLFQMLKFRFPSVGMRTFQTKTRKRISTVKRRWLRLPHLKRKHSWKNPLQVTELDYLHIICFWPSKMSINSNVVSIPLLPSTFLCCSYVK